MLALARKVNEPFDPMNVGLLGPAAVVLAADRGAHLIKQPRFARLRLENHWRFRALIHFLLFNQVANNGRTRITQ
jgi:hypothetical protein